MKNIDEELVCFFNSNDFQRKSKIVNFLKEKKDWGKKKAKAEILLRSIADQFGKGQIYTELIKNNLRIYEDAVKKTLPTHRDHFVHSAYVYLLGIYIFNKDSDYQQQVESNFNSNQPLTKKTVLIGVRNSSLGGQSLLYFMTWLIPLRFWQSK